MLKVNDVAEYIIRKIPVDNLKLQKLLYYCQAVHLVLQNKKPLFLEKIEAWQYGPVIPSVYRKYKKYGFDIIKKDSSKINFSDSQKETIDMVIEYYGNMHRLQLMYKSHSETPWKNAYKKGLRNRRITIDSMYNYFKDVYEFV